MGKEKLGEMKWEYCEKCKKYTNHQYYITPKRKPRCLYCESLKKKKIHGVAKTKPKEGWSKLDFGIRKKFS